MEFGWPVMLWGTLAAPLLLWGYVRAQRVRARYEAVLADPRLLSHLWTRPPAFRRHLPAGFYVAAVALLTIAMARPIAAIPLPTNRAALILAIDVSKSMIGEDVKPSRLEATKEAALQVLDAVPGSTKVGLIAFSDYAQVLVPPTTERQVLREAITALKVLQATGVGSAIVEALRALPERRALLGERLTLSPQQPFVPAPAPPSGSPPVALPPAAVIIFSDGISNLGADPTAAAALAKEASVRIFGVGVGTTSGSVMQVDQQLVLVPFDPVLLQRIAQMTDGRYFAISDRDELRRVSRQVGRAMGWERRRTEITSVVAAAAGLLILTGGAFSLAWFRRIP